MIGFWLKRSWYESYFSHSGIWSGQFVLPPTANKPNADLMLNFNWQKILFMTHVCPHTLYWVVNQPVKVNWANQLLQSWYIRKKRYFFTLIRTNLHSFVCFDERSSCYLHNNAFVVFNKICSSYVAFLSIYQFICLSVYHLSVFPVFLLVWLIDGPGAYSI